MIQAYPDTLSVTAGGVLTLHVGTDHPEFRVVVFRQGSALTQVHDYGWRPALTVAFNPGGATDDWNWDGYEYSIDAEWQSGAYIAMLWERDSAEVNEPDGGTTTSAGKFGKALFVVRSNAPGSRTPMLFRIPIATFHAYNVTGGASLYDADPGRVTMRRPGGGTGGLVTDFEVAGGGDVDVFDTSTSRQTFEHCDAKFIRWLEGNGLEPDYCADIDCHGASGLSTMTPYGVVISVGHDEYWSTEMRANLAAYVAQGGNLAMFSGNNCWWRIRYDEDLSGFACNKSEDVNDAASDHWWIAARFDSSVQSENALIGASYRNGAGWWSPGRPSLGYKVQFPHHWVYEGGVGAEFGASGALVGYEADGAELVADSGTGSATAQPTYQDGTPPGFIVLAYAILENWQDQPHRDPILPTAAVAPRAATMGMYTDSGSVFNAAVTDWPRVLEDADASVVRVTRNVINRLGGIRFGLDTVAESTGLVAIDGFYSDDDRFRHAIFCQRNGDVVEVFFNPDQRIGRKTLGNFSGIVDVAGFYSNDDRFRHAIVATSDGTLTEIFFHPDLGQGEAVLGHFPGIVAIAGFYSSDDHYRHVVIAQRGGSLTELFYHPEHGSGQAALGNFEAMSDVGAFYSNDDHFRHAIVLAGSSVIEVFFNPSKGGGSVEIASIDGAKRLSAFYASSDKFFSRRVVVAANDGRIHEVRYSEAAGVVRSVLTNQPPMTDIGGFWSPDDGFRHAMLGDPGEVRELFY